VSDDLVPVELKNLFRMKGVGGGVLLSTAAKTFAVFIGPGEMHALVLAEGGIEPPRPLSHNLLDSLLQSCHIHVRSVVIDDLVNDTFHAKLTLRQGNREVEIDCRPSDGLVLAVLRKAEIFVTRRVLEQVDDGEELLRAIRRRLEARARQREPEAPAGKEGELGDVRDVPGIDWSFLEELEGPSA
jgi:bifunctional DNase/RNase